jgi:hypothetical protein
MGNIKYLSNRDLSTESNLERIVAAAKADRGLWLMVKEREMEMRAQKAALMNSGRSEKAFRSELKPSLLELAGTLVTRIFGRCPPEMVAIVKIRLLEAAKIELDTAVSGRADTEAGDGKRD